MLIENFTNDGINFGSAGKLAMYDSTVNDNTQNGLEIGNASTVAYVHNSSFDNNGHGVDVSAGMATVADSNSHNNTSGGFGSSGGTLTLYNDRMIFNHIGLYSSGATAVVNFANCLVSNNTTNSYSITNGGSMSGSNPGTSLIIGAGSGSLGAANALQ